MAYILSIETSTRNCSVALSFRDRLITFREAAQGNEHAAKIAVFVSEVLREAGLECRDLDAVAIGKGPGSYTGLRIGVSTAKGLAYALSKPLLAVSPLQAMAFGAVSLLEQEGRPVGDALFCPMTDAGRMEVYSAVYDGNLEVVRDVEADIVEEGSYSGYLRKSPVYFLGDGSEKCRKVLEKESSARFLPGFVPSARYMSCLAWKAFEGKRFEDVAYFEPFYFKDFIAGKPHVKGLD